ncbi:hypothetical protein ACIQCR_16820 [Streptomyces sp. NPDC093249]|uniref:hypothetical protein n=1 Tax=unclassified Streptomyces TaxID=2593676 RepID=UPI00382CEE2D
MRSSRLLTRFPRSVALLGVTFSAAALALGCAPSADETAPAAPTARTVHVLSPSPSAGRGDDNGDGFVDEDESGWDCRTMGNRLCGPSGVPPECEQAGGALQLCVSVAAQPAYGWTNPDGSRTGNPDGRARLRDLEELPGTAQWADAVGALDAEYRAHGPRA